MSRPDERARPNPLARLATGRRATGGRPHQYRADENAEQREGVHRIKDDESRRSTRLGEWRVRRPPEADSAKENRACPAYGQGTTGQSKYTSLAHKANLPFQ